MRKSDRDILDVFVKNRKEGVRMLFDRYYRSLVLYAGSLIDDDTMAEDHGYGVEPRDCGSGDGCYRSDAGANEESGGLCSDAGYEISGCSRRVTGVSKHGENVVT